MIYPALLHNDSLIGITAPSSGVDINKDTAFDNYKANLNSIGFRTIETSNVRTGLTPSSPAEIRANEFNSLIYNSEVDMILCAKGGDLLFEILDKVDYQALKANPKWVQGYSDPTSLLYAITTKYDIATVYGNGAGAYSMSPMHVSLLNSMHMLMGKLNIQHSFDLFEKNKGDSSFGYNLDSKVEWKIIFDGENISSGAQVNFTGRLIGGCVDVLTDLIGTPFDGTKEFIDKYANDGIIWYFDNFAMPAERLYSFLWHMKKCRYFNNASGFIFGRNLFKSTFMDFDYEEAVLRPLMDLNVPIITEADIGHVSPRMAIINGALGEVIVKNKQGTVKQLLV